METKDVRWYKIIRANLVTYTDVTTNVVISRNLVMLEGGTTRYFEYPQASIREMLLKEGDRLKIEGSPLDGKVVMIG